ncbi:MAG: alkaline phosphatase PhoX [Planctomycetota bacterium]
MATGNNGYSVSAPLFTVGESYSGYTPPGILDGLGAYRLNGQTVRVLANHELLNFRGYDYDAGGFSLRGARVSFFDIDIESRQVVSSGLAHERIYDANGNLATDASFLPEPYAAFFTADEAGQPSAGLSRLCSSQLVESGEFNSGNFFFRVLLYLFTGKNFNFGIEDRIYFTGEEDGAGFNSVGGAGWALDPANGDLWQIPDFGRGGWENVTQLDTGNPFSVAFLLMDDTSPFDFDADGVPRSSEVNGDIEIDGDGLLEAAPLYLYVGYKNAAGDFLAKNGLRGGKLYVWVNDSGDTTPAQFNSFGSRTGRWVEIDNSPSGPPSQDGSTGFDEYGYPTQGTLWVRARQLGAFGFSRPEDAATNPRDGREAVLASTGVDSYVGGADTYGTIYTIKTNFWNLRGRLKIIYDGDADPTRGLRSPDNLDWADDGFIYVQEDEAEETDTTGTPLFGPGADNPTEAGIVRLKKNGSTLRVATIDRSVVLDASIPNPTDAVDKDAGEAGEWESSGIIDVSRLFGERKGTLFLFDVQAHGIEDQEDFNDGSSRINDGDLVEGGQLLFLKKN